MLRRYSCGICGEECYYGEPAKIFLKLKPYPMSNITEVECYVCKKCALAYEHFIAGRDEEFVKKRQAGEI